MSHHERPDNPANFCSMCGRDFATVNSFDEHRVGEHEYTYSEGLQLEPPREDGRRCLNDEEMGVWTKDRFGRWVAPPPPPELERVQL